MKTLKEISSNDLSKIFDVLKFSPSEKAEALLKMHNRPLFTFPDEINIIFGKHVHLSSIEEAKEYLKSILSDTNVKFLQVEVVSTSGKVSLIYE